MHNHVNKTQENQYTYNTACVKVEQTYIRYFIHFSTLSNGCLLLSYFIPR